MRFKTRQDTSDYISALSNFCTAKAMGFCQQLSPLNNSGKFISHEKALVCLLLKIVKICHLCVNPFILIPRYVATATLSTNLHQRMFMKN